MAPVAEAQGESGAKRETLTHLPGLDGLRGLSVLAVVLFHKNYSWASGGFLGVSTFFTLSGFLITTLLVLEFRSTGRIDLVAFWGRRARRLLPAAFVTLVGVCVYAWLVGEGVDKATLAGDVGAALIYMANWRELLGDGNYASLFVVPSPIAHFWSLAIEEQFYLVFPLIAAALLALGRRGRRPLTLLTIGLVVLVGGSAAATVLAEPTADSSPVYYSTFTRSGEILLGSIAAVGLLRWKPSEAVRRIAGLVGLVALAALVWAYSELRFTTDWLHRGGFFGIGLLSCTVVAGISIGRGGVNRVLEVSPLRFLGKISYGVYLFHWPIFVFINSQRVGLSGLRLLALQAALILGLAWLSLTLLETPIRRRQMLPRPSAGYLIPVVGLAIFGFALLLVPNRDGVGDLAAALAPEVDVAKDDPASGSDANPGDGGIGTEGGTATDAANDRSSADAASDGEQVLGTSVGRQLPDTDCLNRDGGISGFDVIGDPGTTLPKVMIVGDSVSCTLGLGLTGWAEQRNSLTVLNNGTLACGLLRTGNVRTRFIDDEPISPVCEWGPRWADQVEAFGPDLTVVLVGAWDVYDRTLVGTNDWVAPGDPTYDEFVASEARQAADVLTSEGGRVLWLTSPPIELGRNAPTIEGPWPANDPARMERFNEVISEALASNPRVEIVDLASWAEALPGGSLDPAFRPDGVHFEPESALQVAEWLGPQLESLLDAQLETETTGG